MADNPQAPTRTPTMTDNLEELERLLEERAVAYCYTWAPSRALLRSLIATAREVEGLRAEVARYRERWTMIDQLRGAEGCSVEIIHDNPDFGAPNCAIYVTDNFGEDYSTYYGDTVDDCLRQAVASLNEGKPK